MFQTERLVTHAIVTEAAKKIYMLLQQGTRKLCKMSLEDLSKQFDTILYWVDNL